MSERAHTSQSHGDGGERAASCWAVLKNKNMRILREGAGGARAAGCSPLPPRVLPVPSCFIGSIVLVVCYFITRSAGSQHRASFALKAAR